MSTKGSILFILCFILTEKCCFTYELLMKSSSVSLWYAKYGLLFCYAFAQFVICSNVRVGILLIQCYHYLVKPHKLCICIHEEWILLCWSGVNTNSLDSVQFRFRTQKKSCCFWFIATRCYAVSVRPSHSWILLKRVILSSDFFYFWVAKPF